MKKVFIFFVLVNLLYGGLVPVPFITYPEPIQRVGYGYTKKYFKKYLFKTPYGIAMTKLRNNAGLFIIISDKGWNRVLYTLVKGNECDWIRELKKWETPLGTDEFNMPTGLCIDTTIYQNNPDKYTIYVVDYNRVVILKYTVSEEKLRYSCIFPFNFYSPIDVACITKEDGKGSYIGIVEKDGRKFEIFESNPQQIYQLLYECDKFGYINFISPSSISIAKASYGEGYFVYITDCSTIMCFRFIPNQGIFSEKMYRAPARTHFTSVTASQYFCVYATDIAENKIWVFTPGLGELLYTYGGADKLNRPIDIYIDWDRLGVTEGWTENTGLQYFKIVPEIRELKAEPNYFDAATQDSIKISFRVDETPGFLSMYVIGENVSLPIFKNVYYPPGRHYIYWDIKDSLGNLLLPGEYLINVYVPDFPSYGASIPFRIKGTKINQTHLYGSIWTKENEPYVILNNINIYDSLKIEPGVKVMFNGDYYFNMSNIKCKAIGELTDSIKFLPYVKLKELMPTKSKRFIIKIFGGKTYMNYFKIGYGGQYYSGDTCLVYIQGSKVEIKNGVIEYARGKGIYIYGSDSTGILENIEFKNNKKEGLYVYWVPKYSLKNLRFYEHRNSYPLYVKYKPPVFENIYLDPTNKKKAIYLCDFGGVKKRRLEKNIYALNKINDIDTLLIDAGAILKVDSAGWINVYRYLNISGDQDDTVYITSLKDDEVGGDTNGDSTNTSPSPGDWRDFQLPYAWDGNYSQLNYFCIRYGGAYNEMVRGGANSAGILKNGIIEKSKSKGLTLHKSYFKVNNILFKENKKAGIYISECDSSVFKNLKFSGHKDTFVMQIISGSIPYLDSLFGDGTNKKEGIELKVGNSVGKVRKLPGYIPYVITSSISFNDTIYISKGVIIKFASQMDLSANAPLIAKGDGDSFITFTSLKDDIGGDTNGDSSSTIPNPGDWRNISLFSSSDISYLKNVIIRYGGYGNYGELLIYGNPVIENSIIEKSANYGIYVYSTAYYHYPVIKNCEIRENQSYGIISFDKGIPNLKNIIFKGHKNTYLMKFQNTFPFIDSIFADTTNKKIGIELSQGIINQYTGNRLSGKIPFVLTGNFYSYDTLYISKGVVVKVDSGFGIYFRAPVFAKGEYNDSIYFTSLRDDEIGGNTNSDSILPSPGDWKGISFDSGSKNSLFEFFNVRYGENNINVLGDSIKFLYGNVAKALNYGYGFYKKCEIYFNKIKENKIGIGNPGSVYSVPIVNFSEISDNTEYGIKNTSSYILDAEYNFWGFPTGPYHPNLNPQGEGNPVSNNVDFIPWLNSPLLYISGEIFNDTLLEGVVLIVGDVVVHQNATLRIKEGTKIFVLNRDIRNYGNYENKIEIIVFGKILSEGTFSNNIIFDAFNGEKGGWVGIIVKGQGSSLKYTNIKNSINAIHAENSQNIIIKNCEIKENLSGITLINSGCLIESTLIYKNNPYFKNYIKIKGDTNLIDSLTGINVYNSSLILKNNKIIDNFVGLYASGFLNLYSYGNLIKDNLWHGYDIAVSSSSNLVFEKDSFINNGWYPKNYNLNKKYYIEFAGLSLAHRYYSDTSDIKVINCYFKNNCDGIRIGRYGRYPFYALYDIRVSGCEFDSNFYGVSFHGGYVSHINSIFTKNIINSSDSSNIIIAAPFDSVRLNLGNLENNDTIDDGENHILGSIYSIIDSSHYDIYAQGNLWDYTDSSLIDSKIYDDDENPSLSKVNFKYFYFAGIIKRDTTLKGDIRISGDLIVPENVKLMIESPAILRFSKKFDILKGGNDKNRAELIVYGKLKTDSEKEKIVLTSDGYIKEKGDFYGIVFKRSVKSEIIDEIENENTMFKNFKIEYSYKGIEFLRDEKLKIKDSEIKNSNYGIYFNGKNIEIENSKISLNDTGIYVLKGKGHIKETEIKENEIGILYKGNSEINIDKSYIMNNKIGIYVDENSKPKLKNGKNYICYNSEYNLYNNTIFDIEAQRNFWGTENHDSISLFIYDFYDDSIKGIVYFEPVWVPKEEILSGIQGDKEKIIDFIKINTISKKNFEIEIILNKNSEISLKVYDVSGRKIKEIESKLNSGTYKFEIDNLKKGVYFLEIKINEKKKKFKILKIY